MEFGGGLRPVYVCGLPLGSTSLAVLTLQMRQAYTVHQLLVTQAMHKLEVDLAAD